MNLPRHIAIVMDGNRRWARRKFLPTAAGHAYGAQHVKTIIRFCSDQKIEYLTLFAFSTENWHRSSDEVSVLMTLFSKFLRNELENLVEGGIQLRIAGDRTRFSPAIQEEIETIEKFSAHHTGMVLTIAANYGGRWDILQAAQRYFSNHPHTDFSQINERDFEKYLSLSYAPDVDLLIRTGGESRLSNFLLWQSAYAELYFTDKLWPEFSLSEMQAALDWFVKRERRFGKDVPDPSE